MIVFSFGFVTLLGYILEIKEAYSWRGITGMALHTGITFILAGVGTFFINVKLNKENKVPSWIQVPMMIAVFIIGGLLWRAIEVNRVYILSQGMRYNINYILVVLLFVVFICGIFFLQRCITSSEKIDVARAEAEFQSGSKTKILRYVSHEIRNPLTVVIGYSQALMSNEQFSGVEKEAVDGIYLASIHIKRIVEDLLALSRLESGKIQLECEDYNVRNWFKDFTRPLTMKAEQIKVNFQCKLDENLPETLKGDSQKLAQICMNLVENAFKFVNKEGEVILDLYLDSKDDCQFLMVSVSDNGKGISEEVQKTIFDPFVQGEGSEQRLGLGLGLGLSICKSYLDLMGGEISFESKEGEGTKFLCKVKAFL